MNYAIIGAGIIAALAILGFLIFRKGSPAVSLVSTYDGPVDQYQGGKTLLVAVHAPWAPVWRATAEALSKADLTVYDLKLIDANLNKQAMQELGVTIVPTVIVFKDGVEIARLPNMMSLDQLP